MIIIIYFLNLIHILNIYIYTIFLSTCNTWCNMTISLSPDFNNPSNYVIWTISCDSWSSVSVSPCLAVCCHELNDSLTEERGFPTPDITSVFHQHSYRINIKWQINTCQNLLQVSKPTLASRRRNCVSWDFARESCILWPWRRTSLSEQFSSRTLSRLLRNTKMTSELLIMRGWKNWIILMTLKPCSMRLILIINPRINTTPVWRKASSDLPQYWKSSTAGTPSAVISWFVMRISIHSWSCPWCDNCLVICWIDSIYIYLKW